MLALPFAIDPSQLIPYNAPKFPHQMARGVAEKC